MPLILASGSATRAALLTQAGLIFERDPATVDERAAEDALGDSVGPDDVAMVLAELKARDVSAHRPGAHVIGADQTLALGDRRFHKPASPAAGRAQLASLAGETHHLHSAVVVIRDGEVLFRHQSSAAMTMRPLSAAFLDHYVEVVGDRVMGSVGAYQVEGFGIQLFEAIEGDHFTILGLPLLPLLAFLRHEGLILS